MASKYYTLLVNKNNQLCKHFISDATYSHPGTLLSQDKLRAYRLLIHAEIEYFLETIIRNKVNLSLDAWNSKHKVNRTLLSLLAFHKNDFHEVPHLIKEISSKNDLNYRINKVVSDFYGIIKLNSNHSA